MTWVAENLNYNGYQEVWYGIYDVIVENPTISETKVIDEGGPQDPVISLNYSTNSPTIFSTQYGNIVRYRQKSDESWSSQGFLEGDYPNVCASAGEGAVWSKYHNTPYIIKTDYVPPPNQNPTPLPSKIILNPQIKYTYTINQTESSPDTGYIGIKFEEIRFNNELINFNNPLNSDTVIAPVDMIPLDLKMEISFHNLITPPNDQEILFKVDFIDGNQTIPLTDFKYHEIPDTNIIFTKSTTANNLHYREGYLKFSFVNMEPHNYWVLAEEDTTILDKPGNYSLSIVPNEFKLAQNYPNPCLGSAGIGLLAFKISNT